MWIETCDGELVNMDRAVFVRIMGAGISSEVVAWTGQLDRGGDELGYQLFRGTREACDGYVVALKERLRGGARKLTG